jgi:cytoplasmic iron level regulating protein YaaA (DUF328/UPF0246 family)
MGTKLPVGPKKHLPEFWKQKVTETLNQEMGENKNLINLASNEYFNAIDVKTLKAEIITPQFKDFKNGKLKMISFFAKKARGMMVRYLIDNDCKNKRDLLSFNTDGYQYSEEYTLNENQPVFIR